MRPVRNILLKQTNEAPHSSEQDMKALATIQETHKLKSQEVIQASRRDTAIVIDD
jgi:hypothetical protein